MKNVFKFFVLGFSILFFFTEFFSDFACARIVRNNTSKILLRHIIVSDKEKREYSKFLRKCGFANTNASDNIQLMAYLNKLLGNNKLIFSDILQVPKKNIFTKNSLQFTMNPFTSFESTKAETIFFNILNLAEKNILTESMLQVIVSQLIKLKEDNSEVILYNILQLVEENILTEDSLLVIVDQLLTLDKEFIEKGINANYVFQSLVSLMASKALKSEEGVTKISKLLIDLSKAFISRGFNINHNIPFFQFVSRIENNGWDISKNIFETSDNLIDFLKLGIEFYKTTDDGNYLFFLLQNFAYEGIITKDNFIQVGHDLTEIAKASKEANLDCLSIFSLLSQFAISHNKDSHIVNANNLNIIGRDLILIGQASVQAGLNPEDVFAVISQFELSEKYNPSILKSDNFISIGQKLISIGEKSIKEGLNPTDIFLTLMAFSVSNSKVSSIINEENLTSVSNKLIKLGKTALKEGIDPEYMFLIFRHLTPASREMISRLYKITHYDKAAFPVLAEFSSSYRTSYSVLNEHNLSSIGHQLIKLGKVSMQEGSHVKQIFLHISSITNKNNFTETILSQTIEIAKLCILEDINIDEVFKEINYLVGKAIKAGTDLDMMISLYSMAKNKGVDFEKMFSIIAHTRKKDAEFINIGHKLIKLAEASFDVGASPEIIFNFIWDFTRFNIYALNGDTISETLDLLIEAVYEGEDPNDPENWVNGLIY